MNEECIHPLQYSFNQYILLPKENKTRLRELLLMDYGLQCLLKQLFFVHGFFLAIICGSAEEPLIIAKTKGDVPSAKMIISKVKKKDSAYYVFTRNDPDIQWILKSAIIPSSYTISKK